MAYDFAKLNVLLIDDSAFARKLLKVLLVGLGFRRITEAEDAAEALKLMGITKYDLILVDWEMRPITGMEFTKLVRTAQDSPDPYVPIIMVSAYSQAHRVIAARDAGVHEFLVKPVSANSLYRHLASVIENNRPFIKTVDYLGPDRRRRDDPNYEGTERRLERLKAQAATPPSEPAVEQQVTDDGGTT